MSVIDELLAHNRDYVARHGHRELPDRTPTASGGPDVHGLATRPLRRARARPRRGPPDPQRRRHRHRRRRSLAAAQPTPARDPPVMVIHHTRCGLETFDEETLAARARGELRRTATVSPRRLRRRRRRRARDRRHLAREPLRRTTTEIRGFVFNVDDGDLREVSV